MKIHATILSVFVLLIISNYSQAQDTIVLQSTKVIVAKVMEISGTEVKYKRVELPDGPLFTIFKSDITKIKYSNGSVDEFNAKKTGTVNNATAPVDLSPHSILTLVDGTQLKGKIVSENKNEVVFNDYTIGEKTINREKIKKISSEYGNEIRVFTLNDGTIITGKIINKTANSTVIETKNLGIITLPESKIKQVNELEESTITGNGNIWFKNPNCTRYLFAPSAIQLKKGEGYYQNIYGLMNSFNYGLNDHITIGAGLVGPLGAYINTKVGFKIGQNAYIAAGALLGNSFFPINGNNLGMGIGFGVLTIGNYDHNITVGTGYGFINRFGQTSFQNKPLYVANGMARLAKKYALVTENWIVNVTGDPFSRGITSANHYETFFSYAFRYMGQRSTLDAGFLNTPGLIHQGWYIGIPYVGFVIRFGNYKDN